MSRGSRVARTQDCAHQDARKRLADARKFLEVAELVDDEPVRVSSGVSASLAVLAGIAASDAACCAALGRRSRGDSHAEAAELLSVIEPGAVATELREHISHAPTKKALDAWAEGMRQLQPEDVANAVLYCVTQPPHVNVNEILIRPTDQER